MFRAIVILMGFLTAAAGAAAAGIWAWRERRRRARSARRAARQAERAARRSGGGSPVVIPIESPVTAGVGTRAEPAAGAASAEAVAAAASGSPGTDMVAGAAAETDAPAASGSSGGDDLRAIRGIGSVAEGRLHEMGVTRWDQIAGWSAADIADVAARMRISPDRLAREDWVGQARALVSGTGGAG